MLATVVSSLMNSLRPTTSRSQAILRVRTGCLTCRARKKKCDEQKPTCRGCARNHLECSWPSIRETISRRREKINTRPTEPPTPHTPRSGPASDDNRFDNGPLQPLQIPIEPRLRDTSASWDQSPILNEESQLDQGLPLFNDQVFGFQSERQVDSISIVPPSLSMLPQLGHESFELLSYYLAKTANSMGNGSTDFNPFLTQLVPLAFSSELILQLILSQSAAQRAVMGSDSTQIVAHNYYTRSLGLFRNAVNDFIRGNRADGIMLATGALVLCFTEAR